MNAPEETTAPRLQVEVVTLFPELVRGYLAAGVVGRALERGLVRVGTENPRSHATDVHGTVDDRPYGGGPGMVMKVEPLATAIANAQARLPQGSPRIYLSAQGRPFTQDVARELVATGSFLLLAGRYEGVDERLVRESVDAELSIGDYVLSGGLLAGLLEGPQYTRPVEWRGRRVPEVLQEGNHAAIRRWRLKQALGRTWERRPELLERRVLTVEERELLDEYRREINRGGA
mgnify:CR=1 FL=1